MERDTRRRRPEEPERRVYIQNCRMFNLTKNKRTLHLNYTVNFSQFLKNESVIGIQIFQDHLNEKIINTAGRIALHNFIDLLDLLLKALYMFVVVNCQRDITENNQRQSDFFIIHQSDISFYIPIIFESFDAFIYRRF